MEQSGINDLAAALAKAQLEMQNPGFDSQNPHFRSKFASLASVRNAIVPVLAKHGIALSQDIQTTERGIACLTILTHSSGQQMKFGPLEMPASKSDAQGFGSAATYARRYSMMAVCAVVGDEDDDGNAAAASTSPLRQAAQKVVKADVRPAAGVAQSLTAEERANCNYVVKQVVDAFASENADLAYNIWHEATFSADEKVAAWDMLDSKMRSTLKKMHAEREVTA